MSSLPKADFLPEGCSRCNSKEHDTASCQHRPSVQDMGSRLRVLERENRRLIENYNVLAERVNGLRSRRDAFEGLPHPLPYAEKKRG